MVIAKMEIGNGACLDTVRALHQTVVSLRAALEQSKSEIIELKSKAWPLESVGNVIKSLSIENHVLRQKIIEKEEATPSENKQFKELSSETKENQEKQVVVAKKSKLTRENTFVIPPKPSETETDIVISTENLSPRKFSQSLENLTLKPLSKSSKKLSISKTVSFSNILECKSEKRFYYFSENIKMSFDSNHSGEKNLSNMQTSENSSQELEQDQEVDEVELIFTTDDTKEQDFKEALVSIDTNVDGSQLLQCPTSEFEHSHASNLSAELDDDVFNDNFENENQENSTMQTFERENSHLYNSKSDNSINHEEKSLKSYYSYQDSSFENKSLEKDESFDRFEEKIRIIETDISKIGIQDVEYSLGRRNTCPNPLQYRPILHR